MYCGISFVLDLPMPVYNTITYILRFVRMLGSRLSRVNFMHTIENAAFRLLFSDNEIS